MFKASCHCEAVQIEFAEMPASITRCNCSICRRYGAMWGYFTRATVELSYNREAVGSYSWNDKCIEFKHCKNCGCLTHYEDSDKSGDYRVAINMRMLSPASLDGVAIRDFDGENM